MADTLWARIQPVLRAADPQSTIHARALLDAIVHRAFTDMRWNELPYHNPSPADVITAMQRWQELGVLDQLEAVVVLRLGQ